MEIAYSVNNVLIRLTEERWKHISPGHPEMASYFDEILETIEKPDAVYKGEKGEFIAVRKIKETNAKVALVA
jgi:hypothetical protein